jgi:hypothetical protein
MAPKVRTQEMKACFVSDASMVNGRTMCKMAIVYIPNCLGFHSRKVRIHLGLTLLDLLWQVPSIFTLQNHYQTPLILSQLFYGVVRSRTLIGPLCQMLDQKLLNCNRSWLEHDFGLHFVWARLSIDFLHISYRNSSKTAISHISQQFSLL